MNKTSSHIEKAAKAAQKTAAAPIRRFSISKLTLAGRPMVTISAKAS